MRVGPVEVITEMVFSEYSKVGECVSAGLWLHLLFCLSIDMPSLAACEEVVLIMNLGSLAAEKV